MIEFVHPGFLWALPAVLVPVLIHILNRRRYRRVLWAAMEHLMRAERRSRRRIRWQNLLVLLLRSSAVLLLILLFARPYFVRPLPGLSGPGVARAGVVVLLDDSASMAQSEGGTSALEKGKDFTLSVVRELAPSNPRGGLGAGGRGAGVTACVASQEKPFFHASPVRSEDVARLKKAMDRLRPVAAVFEPATRLPALGAQAAGQAGDLHFYVVTDLRAADWGAERLDPGARRGLEALQEYGTVCLIGVGAEPDDNVGIADVLGMERLTYARAASLVRFTVQNDAVDERAASVLSVRLDGRLLPLIATPPVPAGKRREVPLEVYLDEPGCHALEASLPEGDSFRPDDGRFAVLEAVERVPVLIVEGDPGTSPSESSSYYLRTALQPAAEARTGILPEVHYAGSGAREDLEAYAAVFLCNVASPAPWQKALGRYAAAGGRVVVFLGDRVNAEAWNRALFDEETGLLPCRLEGRVRLDPAQAVHLAGLDSSHSLLRPFSDWGTLFSMPRFTGFHRVRPLGDTAVLARFDDVDSSPAILARPVGDGSAVLFASSADDDWTDWPRSEAGRITYLALMHWLVESGAAAGRPKLNLVGGSRIEYPLDPSRFRPEATLRLSGGVDRHVPAGSGEYMLRAGPHEQKDGLWLTSGPLTESGIWELALSRHDGGRESVLFAVNTPEGERLLALADPEMLLDAVVSPGRLRVLRYGERLLESVLREPAGPGRYWPALAFTIVLVLILDSLFAYFFGNPAGVPGGRRERGRRAP